MKYDFLIDAYESDVKAARGVIGHVEDVLVDRRTWEITHLIVATGNWWDGHRVLVSSRRIKALRGSQAEICVDLTRQAVSDSPRYGLHRTTRTPAGRKRPRERRFGTADQLEHARFTQPDATRRLP
jgi:sporulation protein YlmC with PRC-barrel domain